MPYLYSMFDTVLRNAMLNNPTNPIWLRIDGDYNYGECHRGVLYSLEEVICIHFSERQLRDGDETLSGGDLHV